MGSKKGDYPPIVSQSDLFGVLREFNPWWQKAPLSERHQWRRAAFPQLMQWLVHPPAPRAVLISGARQIGKTTLLLQAAEQLVANGTPPQQILYATFDHPLLKLAGLDGVLRAWRESVPGSDGTEYLLLDEIQAIPDWQTWIKHQVDFRSHRRIAATGSALPILAASQESAVGRLHTIKLPTLSFCEYLQIRQAPIPSLPDVRSLSKLFQWSSAEFVDTAEAGRPLVGHFHEYLLRGGFPQTAKLADIKTAQRLLREDIVDKVLKRDMTALFGVRRILELEKLFIYLCMHDGGLLDIPTICSNLELNKQTVNNFIDLLEAANLIYKLPPFGYGKEVLRARYKVYLADAAISGSVMLRGESLLNDPTRLGAAAETAFFKHVFTNYYMSSIGFSYWKAPKGQEVDILAETRDQTFPFEVKYASGPVTPSDLAGLRQLLNERNIDRAYVITRNIRDFGPIELPPPSKSKHQISRSAMRIPAPLACFWLSRMEQHNSETS